MVRASKTRAWSPHLATIWRRRRSDSAMSRRRTACAKRNPGEASAAMASRSSLSAAPIANHPSIRALLSAAFTMPRLFLQIPLCPQIDAFQGFLQVFQGIGYAEAKKSFSELAE